MRLKTVMRRCTSLPQLSGVMAHQLRSRGQGAAEEFYGLGGGLHKPLLAVMRGQDVLVANAGTAVDVYFRAYVFGFAHGSGLARLERAVRSSSGIKLVTYTATANGKPPGITISRYSTGNHAPLESVDFATPDELRRVGPMSPQLLQELVRTPQFVCYDTQWGRNSMLWPALNAIG